jgi:hypothetical protein
MLGTRDRRGNCLPKAQPAANYVTVTLVGKVTIPTN